MQDRWLTDWDFNPRFPFLTRANAGEVLPDPVSPLGWTLVWEQGCLKGWRESAIYDYGSNTADEIEEHHPAAVGHHGGYLFLNGTSTRIFAVRGPGLTVEAIDAVYYGTHPDTPPYEPEPWHKNDERSEKIGAWMGGVVMADDLPLLRDDRQLSIASRTNRPDLASLTDAQLVVRIREQIPLIQHLFRRHLAITAASSIGPGIVGAVAAAMGDESMAMRLLSGVGDVDSAAPSHAMWALSRLDENSAEYAAGFASFLQDFGSRGPNEWDIHSETWETKPSLANALISVMRTTPTTDAPFARNDDRIADREQLTAQLTDALAGDPATQGQFLAGLRSANLHLQGRERAKTNVVRPINEVRVAVRELGRRHGLSRTTVCMLLDTELEDFVANPQSFATTLADREAGYLELFDLEPPFIINGEAPPLSQWKRRSVSTAAKAEVGDVLTGIAGCPGVATGRARVILDPSDPFALEPGDVLIAPITDPAWTPLFVPSSAVVVNVGAQVSHAVIVSRELGIPCVVSVLDATNRIPDGATITVDGTNGTVTVIAVP